jgi:hypothetical protein
MRVKAAHRVPPSVADVGTAIGAFATFIVCVAAALWYEFAPLSERRLRGFEGEGNEIVR